MKNLFVIAAALFLSVPVMAQGNSQGKGNGKSKEKARKVKTVHPSKSENNGVWEGVNNRPAVGKGSKNQPKKVQAALLRDYPGASNVTWSKYKGDYTATFNNGIQRSTAIYHANGERRDTRTPLTRQQLPGTIWDVIFKRDKIVPTTYIQIERPTVAERIYRVLAGNNTAYYYNANGVRVQYDY